MLASGIYVEYFGVLAVPSANDEADHIQATSGVSSLILSRDLSSDMLEQIREGRALMGLLARAL